MNLDIEYSDHEEAGFGVEALEEVVRETIMASRYGSVVSQKDVRLSVALLSSEEMQRVNHEFRDTDAATDVISIGDYADEKDLSRESAAEIELGEVLLCWEFVQESATIHAVDPFFELAQVLSHGVLHLTGYEHSDEMFTLQSEIARAHISALKQSYEK